MKTFRDQSIKMIKEHVRDHNPIISNGDPKQAGKNQPFFMYLSWRAPHRPMSHDWDFDPNNPTEHMPYVAFGKPGEQLGIFDRYVGDVMKTLEQNQIADNTLVLFTSDNGPDGAGFAMLNKMGHLRLSTLRGSKASVYEGGHRVPFLSWWPLGIHKALHGTNYDLPVSQTDFFATFADILDYPLPNGDQCIYGYDSTTAAVHNRNAKQLGRKVIQNCVDEDGPVTTQATTTQSSTTGGTTVEPTSPTTQLPGTTTLPTTDFSDLPGGDWVSKGTNANKCSGKSKAGVGVLCDWVTCDECGQFWENHKGDRTSKTWLPNKIRNFCRANKKCADPMARSLRALPVCQYTSSAPKGSAEHKRFAYGDIEKWQAHEQQTGFLLGWQGCMAEDSHSFAAAFGAHKVETTRTHEKFATNLNKVETKIFAGKLGDLSLRLGR